MKIITGFLAVLFTFVFCTCLGVMIYRDILFDRDCTGHIKRAADANTVDLALKEMEVVISYVEKNNLTSGYTSVLYNTPDEDVGFWYSNLKASLQELKIIKPDATQLEKSNILMKLRETLLDQGQSTHVTLPQGISRFPHNTLFVVWLWGSFIFALVLWILFFLAIMYD